MEGGGPGGQPQDSPVNSYMAKDHQAELASCQLTSQLQKWRHFCILTSLPQDAASLLSNRQGTQLGMAGENSGVVWDWIGRTLKANTKIVLAHALTVLTRCINSKIRVSSQSRILLRVF